MKLALRRAIVSGDYDKVVSLLASNTYDLNSLLPVDPEDVPFEHENYPLDLAITGIRLPLVRLLVEHGADADIRDYDDKNLLWRIILKMEYTDSDAKFTALMDILRFLVDNGLDVNNETYGGATAINEARKIKPSCERNNVLGQYNAFISYLENRLSDNGGKTKKRDPSYVDSLGRNYFLIYGQNGNWKACKEQMEAGADPNKRDKRGNTLLHRFARFGERFGENADVVAFVEYLIGAGVNLDVPNNEGDTPLVGACNNNTWGFARMLIDAGVDPSDVMGHLETISEFNEGARSLLSHIRNPAPVKNRAPAADSDAAPAKRAWRHLSPRALAVCAIVAFALVTGGAFAFARKGIRANAAANRAAGYEAAWEVHTKEPISSIALSPDGKLAAVSTHYDARIYDVATGKETARHVLERGYRENEPSTIFSIAFSPDGTRLALGYEDGKIRILDAKTGDIVRGRVKDIKLTSGAVDCVVFTDGGNRLLVDLGTSIEVLYADSLVTLEYLDDYADKSVSFTPCPDGRNVVFLSPGKEKFFIFDTVTMRRIPLKSVSPKDYLQVHFGTDMKTVRMIDRETAKVMTVADYPSGKVRKRIDLPGDNGPYVRAVPCVDTDICVVFGENDPVVVDTSAGTARRLVPSLPAIRPEPTTYAVINRDGNVLARRGRKKAVFWRKL